MAEKIGKYQVLERIGRGGMGMIFKAHDPVLDRSVALKVISREAEVAGEVRARFFREAQACARLSHPNIVTLYDMGEDNGRLYIVMELLDGEELRRFITRRKTLALEDKLAIMVQVCAGLHYAHQKRIVHRDIKPGNIMVLRNGQVKILDFGIAQVATTSGGVTRTGLIVGTLRYMSPEQGQGRADYRSDIFSVGSVFYELLSSRPPWSDEDPMQILEQIRTQEPPPLSGIDPTIPSALTAIIARAMQKDPKDRFTDLGQMQCHIEQVQRSLADEAQRVRARLFEQRNRLRELQAALADRIGPPTEEETVLTIDERGRLAALQALDHDLARRIETLQARIARADALAPAVQRGAELSRTEHFADAIAQFEAVLAEIPGHARALEGIAQARARADAKQHRQLAVQLVQNARTALRDGGYAPCLEILIQAANMSPPAELAHEIESLRQAAAAALAGPDADHRAHQQAGHARPQTAEPARMARAPAPNGREDVAVPIGRQKHHRAHASPEVAEDKRGETLKPASQVPAGSSEVSTRSTDARTGVAPERHVNIAEALDETYFAEASQLYVRDRAPVRHSQASGRLTPERTRVLPYLAFSLALGSLLALLGYWLYPSPHMGPDLEVLRRQVADARERATRADAATLAAGAFSAAEAMAGEGDRAAAARTLTGATQAYRGAAERYGLAERNAHIKREERVQANEGRDRMAAVKQGARPASGDFAAALVLEQEGNSMYERLAFKDAAASFRAATEMFAKASPPVQDPPPAQQPRAAPGPRVVPDPRAEIRALLNDYVRAVERKDLALLRRVRSGLTEDELRRLRASFEITRSHKVELRVYEIRITGDEAEALGRREDVLILQSGQRVSTDIRFVYTVRRGPRGWVIHGVRESADRSTGPQPSRRSDSTSSGGLPHHPLQVA